MSSLLKFSLNIHRVGLLCDIKISSLFAVGMRTLYKYIEKKWHMFVCVQHVLYISRQYN